MEFSLSEEQEQVRRLAKKIFGKLATPEQLAEVEAQPDFFHRPLWEALAQAGLLGIALPEETGGTSAGFLALCVLLEEQGRTCAPVPLLPALGLGGLGVARFGSQHQRQRFLPGLADGSLVLSATLCDGFLDEGTLPRAAADGAGWRLFGTLSCVPAAHLSVRVLVAARTADRRTLLALLDPRAAGVTLEPQTATTGEPLWRLRLSGAQIADEALLAGDGEAALGWLTERGLVGLCALACGVASRQLELIAEYTSQRQQFGRPIASFQAVSQRAADAYIAVESMRLSTWQAAWRLDAGLPAEKEVAVAKYVAAEAGQAVANAAQHLHGGIGFDRAYPLYRYYLFARQLELSLGGAAVHLSRLGAALAVEGLEGLP